MRKFWLAAESAIHRIEDACIWATASSSTPRLTRSSLVEILSYDAADCMGLSLYLLGTLTVCTVHARQYRAEPRSSVPAIGREVCATKEDLAFGREKRGERPAALLCQSLDSPLVRAFTSGRRPDHLDADKVLVQESGEPRDSRMIRHP